MNHAVQNTFKEKVVIVLVACYLDYTVKELFSLGIQNIGEALLMHSKTFIWPLFLLKVPQFYS